MIERVIGQKGAVSFIFIDFDKQRILHPPFKLKFDRNARNLNVTTLDVNADLKRWVNEHSIDAVIHVANDTVGVRALRMVRAMTQKGHPYSFRELNKITPRKLVEALSGHGKTPANRPARFQFVLERPLVAHALPFATNDGGMGVLQIVGFTDKPKGVKIRYKILKHPKVNKTTTTPEMVDPTVMKILKRLEAPRSKHPNTGAHPLTFLARFKPGGRGTLNWTIAGDIM